MGIFAGVGGAWSWGGGIARSEERIRGAFCAIFLGFSGNEHWWRVDFEG